MDEILVVPDVHGRSFWRKVIDSDLPVVFLGDYLDPYSFENIDNEMALKEFKDIVKFAEMEPDRVTLLLGNHMLHYCGLSNDSCRFDFKNAKEIYNILNDYKPLFQHAFKWGNTLFTHAGVTKGWLKQNNYEEDPNSIVNLLNSNIVFTDKYLSNPDNGAIDYPIGQISIYRGGYYHYGSPAWADLLEVSNDCAFKDSLIQIFGHTQLKNTGSYYHDDNYYCCDSRSVFIWDGKDLKVY